VASGMSSGNRRGSGGLPQILVLKELECPCGCV
jgi:hypothetical protein